jgi:hypothetical protein
MVRFFGPTAVLIVLGAPPVSGQDVPCPEFPVNKYTASAQTAARVASAPNGDFVVVWTSFRASDDSEIIGRQYDSSAQPRGPAFLVNTYTTGRQSNPDVAVDSSGSFVVVWSGEGNGDPSGIFGQRYDASGTPQGGEFQVNTTPSAGSPQSNPAVAAEAGGAFVVVWERAGYAGPSVFGQRHDAGGIRQGPEFQLNIFPQYANRAAISVDSAGGFVVVWGRPAGLSGIPTGVFARRFGPGGTPLGDPFAVDTSAILPAKEPRVAHGPDGDFLVVWGSQWPDPNGAMIFGRRFDSSGVAQGSAVRINGAANGSRPAMAAGPMGYIVAWNTEETFARRVDPSGVPLGSDFRVNTYTTAQQGEVSVAPTLNGGFVAVWSSAGQDGDDSGVFGSLSLPRGRHA